MKQSKKETKTTRQPATGKVASTRTQKSTLSSEERQHMIAEAAYYRAEQRGFQDGNPERDWLESEAEINRRLTA